MNWIVDSTRHILNFILVIRELKLLHVKYCLKRVVQVTQWFYNFFYSWWSIGDDLCSDSDRSFTVIFLSIVWLTVEVLKLLIVSRSLDSVLLSVSLVEVWDEERSVINKYIIRYTRWLMTCDWIYPFIIINDTLSDLKGGLVIECIVDMYYMWSYELMWISL